MLRKRGNTSFSSSVSGNLALAWFSRSNPLNTPKREISTILVDLTACGRIAPVGTLHMDWEFSPWTWSIWGGIHSLGVPWEAWLLELRVSPVVSLGATWMELFQGRLLLKSGWLPHLLNVLSTLLSKCHLEVRARKSSPLRVRRKDTWGYPASSKVIPMPSVT